MSEIGRQGRTADRLLISHRWRAWALVLPLLMAIGSAAAQEADQAQPEAPQQADQLVAPESVEQQGATPSNCPAPPLRNWTESEKYTWEQLCLGQWADLPLHADDPAKGTPEFAGWKPARDLGAAFLTRIMTDPVFVAATPYTGIRIDGAHFPDGLYLSDLEYNKPIEIINSVFSGPVWMERYRSRSQVRLAGSWLAYSEPPAPDGTPVAGFSLRAGAIDVAEGLDLRTVFVNAQVDLTDSRIGKHLQLDKGIFLATMRLDRARIGSMLYMEGTTIADMLVLDAADIGQNVLMIDAAISKTLPSGETEYGTLSGTQLHVAGHLILGSSSAEIAMPVRLIGQTGETGKPMPEGEADIAASQAGEQDSVQDADLGNTGASLPPANQTDPLATGDLAAGSLAANAADIAGEQPKGERTFSVSAWRITLTGARIDGEMRMRRLRVLDRVTLEDAVIGDDVWLTETDAYDVLSSAVSIKGFALLHGLHVENSLSFDSANIGRSVVMDKDTELAALRMPGAIVKGGIYFAGAKVNGYVDLDSIAVDRDLALGGGSVFKGAIGAGSARIAGSLDLSGGTFATVDFTSVTVERDFIMGGGATFSGPMTARFARIGGSLDLTGGRFASVDLTGAKIAAELRLAAAGTVPEFARSAELNLRNAATYSLQDVAESWPCVLHLEGFTYQRQIRSQSKARRAPGSADPCSADAQAGPQSASAQSAPTQPAPTQSAPVDPDAAAANRAEELANWLARQDPFSPQPYVQLANVLRQSGDNETAKAILFAGKQRELRAAGWWSTILLSLQYAFTGFGLYPYVAGIWVLALIAVGTIVFGLDPSPEIRRFSLTQRIIYSLDMLIPAVHLRHHHAEIELQSWPRYYLYGHKLMGYVLLTFLAAALLGLGGLE